MRVSLRRRGAILVLPVLALAAVLLAGNAGASAPTGAVYAMTNSATGNAVIAYTRAADGKLASIATYPTGGTGTGLPRLGSQNSVLLSPNHHWLFVTNAGSDDVTVFAVAGDGSLKLADRQSSQGDQPESITISNDLVYVLNTGKDNNIAGFRFHDDGRLTYVAGSQRKLSERNALPAEVAFSPDGSTLVVTERVTNRIDTFDVRHNGRASRVQTHSGVGVGPFGFAFRHDGVFIVTDSFFGAAGQAAASSYSLALGVRVLSGAVQDTQSDVCWTVISKDEHYAYVTNNGDGTISSYAIADDGSISLLRPVAGTTGTGGGFGARDEDLDDSGNYLYAIDVGTKTMNAFMVRADGTLTKLAAYSGLPATVAGTAAY